jgi:hypothetical protein
MEFNTWSEPTIASYLLLEKKYNSPTAWIHHEKIPRFSHLTLQYNCLEIPQIFTQNKKRSLTQFIK